MTDLVFYGSSNKTVLEGEEPDERPVSTDASVYGAIDEIGGGEGDDDDEDGDEEDMRIYFERVADHIKECKENINLIVSSFNNVCCSSTDLFLIIATNSLKKPANDFLFSSKRISLIKASSNI